MEGKSQTASHAPSFILKIQRDDYGRLRAALSVAPNLLCDCRNNLADCGLLFDLIRRYGYAGAAFTSVLVMIHGQ